MQPTCGIPMVSNHNIGNKSKALEHIPKSSKKTSTPLTVSSFYTDDTDTESTPPSTPEIVGSSPSLSPARSTSSDGSAAAEDFTLAPKEHLETKCLLKPSTKLILNLPSGLNQTIASFVSDSSSRVPVDHDDVGNILLPQLVPQLQASRTIYNTVRKSVQNQTTYTFKKINEQCAELIKKYEIKDYPGFVDTKIALSQSVLSYYSLLYSSYTRKDYTYPNVQPVLTSRLDPELLAKVVKLFRTIRTPVPQEDTYQNRRDEFLLGDYRKYSTEIRKQILIGALSNYVDVRFGNLLLDIPHYFSPLSIFEALLDARINIGHNMRSIEEYLKFYKKYQVLPADVMAHYLKPEYKYGNPCTAGDSEQIQNGGKLLAEGLSLERLSYEVESICALAKKALYTALKHLNKKDRLVTSGKIAVAIRSVKGYAKFYRQGEFFKENWYSEKEKADAQKPKELPIGLSPWKLETEHALLKLYNPIEKEFEDYDWYKKNLPAFVYSIFF